jgi:hypothetical protein
MAGYRLPGTRIEDVTEPSSVAFSSSQRIPCFIGVASANITVKYEEVTRGAVGLADSLVYSDYGIYDIIQVGTQKGLSDLIETTHWNLTSDQIVFTSSGVITVGATYYVTYKYVRPYDADNLTDADLNDYRYKEFTSYEDVVNDLGDDIPANPLVGICKIALRYFNVPKIAVVQSYSSSVTDMGIALNMTKYRNVQDICLLSTSSSVRNLGITHVTERSLPDNKRYRMLWTGAAAGTEVGSSGDATSLCGLATAIQNERVILINATRALYYYNDPTTREELSTTVDGAFIAATICAYRASFTFPATNLMGRTIAGIELYEEDYDDYYSEYMLTQAGGSSVFLTKNVGTSLVVVDDITTDNSTVERNNINIITVKDYIATDVAYQLDRTFIGDLIFDRSSYANTVKAYLGSMFAGYKAQRIIADIESISVSLDSTRNVTINIKYNYVSVYTLKYIEGQYTLVV